MRQKLFRRLGALLVAFLMLLPVLAMPIVAEDAETGQQANGFAVYQFENLKTIGENLSGQIQYLGDSGVAAYPYRCSVDLMPDTWYYLRYSGAATQHNHTPVYMLYHGSKLTFSPDSVAYTEFILYTGKQSGTCRLEIYSPDALSTCIADHALYRVSSFDTIYDVRYTSFAQDHSNLFPEIDLSGYKGVTGDFIELLTVYENITIAEDYTWDGQVYLYLFNPSGKQITGGTLTCPDDDGKSASFSLIPVVTMEDVSTEDWRFMKLEVTGHWWHQYEKNQDGSVNIHTRRRQITDLTLKFEDGSSKTFPYNGSFIIEDQFSEVQTPSTDSAEVIGHKVTGNFAPTVDIDFDYTFYRTDTSPNGAYYHNQVDSIYFNVPNYLKESYGKLTDVRVSYRKARTTPAIVVDNQELYNALLQYVFLDATNGISKAPLLYDSNPDFVGGLEQRYTYEIVYNKALFPPQHYSPIFRNTIDKINLLFKVDDADAGIRSEKSTVKWDEILKWMYDNTVTSVDTVQGASGLISRRYFSEVDNDVTVLDVASLKLNAESYATNHNFFEKWAEYGFAYALNGSPSDIDLDLSQKIIAIENEGQLSNPDKLYFTESDTGELRNCLMKAKSNDSTMYLVRFNVSQYYMCPLNADYNGKINQSAGYAFAEDVYLDFHILRLSYQKEDGTITHVPVSTVHKDLGGDGTEEKTPEQVNSEARDDLWSKITDRFAQFGKILAMILGIVALVLIVVFVVPVVSPIFKAIFGAIGGVFRWIGEKFRGVSAKRKQRRSGRK